MSRDGFVTNQRYQNLKDSKHSACVLSTCYDEVFQAIDDDDEDGENSDTSDSQETVKKPVHHDSVVINMYNEEEDSDNDEKVNNKNNKSKEKFEKNLSNYTQQKKVLEDDPILKSENKYEKDEELLKKYENECRFGTSNNNKSNFLKNINNEPDINNDDNDDDTMQSIDYFKFKSNFIAKANLMNNGSRAGSVQTSTQRMRNDFDKNEDDDEEEQDQSFSESSIKVGDNL